ncbi:MAG: response regulator [Bacteroidota bacterium]
MAADSTMFLGSATGLSFLTSNQQFSLIDNTGEYRDITQIVEDKDGPYLWFVGWGMQLVRYNHIDNSFEKYSLPRNETSTYSLVSDDKGFLWVGTWGSGLYRFDKNDKIFTKIDIKPGGEQYPGIDYDVVLDIYQDIAGDIWVGTDGGGIVRLSEKKKFHSLEGKTYNKELNLHVNAVLEDTDGLLWIGSKGNGLFILENEDQLISIGFKVGDPLYHKTRLVVRDIYQDELGLVWVSINDGVYIIKKENDGTKVLVLAAEVFNSPDLLQITKAHDILLKGNELWIGTQHNGLFLFNKKESHFQFIRVFKSSEEENQITNNRVSSLNFDLKDRLWVGTYSGLFLYQSADSSFLPLDSIITGNTSSLCEIILCTHTDRNNTLWIGTPCSLTKIEELSPGHSIMVQYNMSDGLPDDYINAIMSDDKGNIWVSTNTGISQFDMETETFRNYDEADGVGESDFSESSSCRTRYGKMYFGGFSNLTFFYPSEIEINHKEPPIVITDIKVLNKHLLISKDGLLQTNINELPKLELGYREKEFSVEFAALDYKAPERNQYAYWLEDRDTEPIKIGPRRHISFSNLDPGEYILHLMGTNSNGVWSNNSYDLEIKITPAPWRTWYAAVIYLILIISLVSLISLFGIKQERLRNTLKLERIKREQETELNEYKLRFFTNISHELRTPLTLILAPINELISKGQEKVKPEYYKSRLRLMYQNANRLYSLINQLLEFRKMEAGKVKLAASETNFKDFLNRSLKSFEELAQSRNILFEKTFKGNNWNCYIDPDKMSVILNNLVSNAFKYAGDPAEVKLEIEESVSNITFKVINNGKGIHKKDIAHIFDRFYQAGDHHASGSSGIGLTLVKNYIDLHKGEIFVNSIVNDLTTFTVILRKGDEHLTSNEIAIENDERQIDVRDVTYENNARTRSVNTGIKGEMVLVVEDNEEVRSYLVDLLSEQYNVLEARNGLEGIELTIEYKPSLVISDVMMPLMDGFELCQRIKSNDTISHIPVIILTAKGSPQDQLFGTRKGADVYLTKPFDPELLIEKVKALMSTRKKLAARFSKKVTLAPNDAEISSEESKFLEKAIKVIEKHIGDFDFNSDRLASEMAMSSSTFYRKTKKLTQQTPGELIKTIRLKRAAQYLTDSQLSVSEICESVGYMDIKSFRRNFNKLFEMNPMEYREQK